MLGLGSSCFDSENLPVGDGAAGLKYHPEVDPAAPPSVRSQSLPCRNSHFTESGLPSGSGFVPRRSIFDPLHFGFPTYTPRRARSPRLQCCSRRAGTAQPYRIFLSPFLCSMWECAGKRELRSTWRSKSSGDHAGANLAWWGRHRLGSPSVAMPMSPLP
jgi:hypothetical protein